MSKTLKAGDKVMVPRTGGGYSLGTILLIVERRALVEFAIGKAFRGRPVNPGDENKMATKNVALKDLILKSEPENKRAVCLGNTSIYVLRRRLFNELGESESSVIRVINENFRLKGEVTELRIID